jgi:hypothetical protein
MKSVRTSIMALLFLAIFAVAGLVVSAQTTLVTGDIAFSGYKCNDAVPDQFSFVLLKNITANTVIRFSDYGWHNDVNAFSNGPSGILESEIVFTATTALTAGQEITIVGTTVTIVNPGSGTAVHTVGAQFLAVTNISLASNGDQIFAYQGTFGSPTFIAGIHMNVNVFANPGDPPTTTAAAWDGLVPLAFRNNNQSALPPALITGTNANWFATEQDNVRFLCGSTPIGSIAAVRAALNSANTTPANWQVSNTNPSGFTLPTGCAYLVPTAANVSVSGRVLTSDGRGIRNAIVVLTDQNGVTRTARSSSFGYYGFDGVQAGGTYVMSVSSKRYVFNPRVVSVSDELTGVDFVADPPQIEKSLK